MIIHIYLSTQLILSWWWLFIYLFIYRIFNSRHSR